MNWASQIHKHKTSCLVSDELEDMNCLSQIMHSCAFRVAWMKRLWVSCFVMFFIIFLLIKELVNLSLAQFFSICPYTWFNSLSQRNYMAWIVHENFDSQGQFTFSQQMLFWNKSMNWLTQLSFFICNSKPCVSKH